MSKHVTTVDAAPYVGADWLSSDESLEVADLATDSTFSAVEAATPEHAERALAAAAAAEAAMDDSTIPQRAAWCEAIAAGIRDRSDELAEVIVREAGKPIASARGEAESAAERFDRAAEEARALTGEYREGTTAGHEGWEAIVKYEPLGTVLCVAPYNYPLATTALQVAPALAAGNCVVLKPASYTPVSGAILAEIVADVGLPPGTFNFVPGRSSEIGDVLAGDDRIDAVALTGSSGAGEHVARESGMVHLHMELGGNAPAIVFPDADLEAAAAACAKGGLKYAGQRCSAVSRVLAHESVHDEVVDLIDEAMDEWTLGDLFDEETALGPLIDEGQAEWVETLVDDAVEKDADLVRGGERDGRTFEPTLLSDVPVDARVVSEEQFGPVVPVVSVEDRQEAIEVANDTDLGLDGSVFTSDYDRALEVADALDVGAVRINGAPSHGLGDVPYGGNGASGIGREGLHHTIEEFLTSKSIVL